MSDLGTGNLYGLFIGVNRYESEDIRPLAFASADVLAVRDKLAERFGLKYENTEVLVDDVEGGLSPTRRQILRAMNRFAGAPMRETDLFLFVFAGHGFSCAGRTYLAARDSEIASEALLRETAVSLETIRDFLGHIPARQQVLILDACRDAPLKGIRSVGAQIMSGDMTRDIGAVIRPSCSAGARDVRASAVLCSCWEGQVAHEYAQAGHGWFCYNLLAELEEAVEKELSLSELHRRIKKRMRESAWRLLPAATNQVPHLLIEGDVPTLRLSTSVTLKASQASSAAPAAAQIARQYCSVCGSLLAEERFRCTRCGQVCCLACRDARWGFCAKCAETIRSRTKMSVSKPKAQSRLKEPQKPVERGFVTVPGGEFQMGRKREIKHLPEFQVALTAVTCAEYNEFLRETGYRPEGRVSELLARRPGNHPVGNVTYRDAEAYARWVGCVLPTEEQWEKAARGTDGRSYPWGDSFDLSRCNSADSGRGSTLPVNAMPDGQSPFGCYQMSGNVWEWTSSWYGAAHTQKVVRGGSYEESARLCTCYYREGIDPRYSRPDLGFRCAKSIP